jgi:gas vesicle protein
MQISVIEFRCKGEEMKSQSSEHDEKKQGNHQGTHQGSRLTYLVAGLGIGALVGVLLAPKSGDETREWLATKYNDGIDSVNEKVKQTRQQVAELIDRGQQQVVEAVDKGREAFSKAKAAGA